MSIKADKIKNRLENKGYKNVEVWYEPVRKGAEMMGPERRMVFYRR